MDLNRVKVDKNGLMDPFMMAYGFKIKCKAMENIFGLMDVNMKDNG